MVAGGFPVQSYITRLMCFTSFTILLVVFPMTSHGISALSAVMKSVVVTARRGNGIIIRSFISHDSNRTHVGQCCEVLADFVGDSGFVDFFAPDRVGVLYHFDFLGGYFADDTDAKSRARNG